MFKLLSQKALERTISPMVNEEKKKNRPKDVPLEEVDMDALKRASMDDKAVTPYASEKGSAPISFTSGDVIKNRSHSAMVQQIDKQMEQIKEQIQLLATQVERLQQRKEISEMVYTATMTFEPIVGHTYFLYDYDGVKKLMMISPTEWKSGVSNRKFLAEVTLLADRTWDVKTEGEE